VTRFVVLTSPRSGSGWLIDMLNSHPAIAAHAELFHVERRTSPDYGARDLPYFETYLTSATPRTRRLRIAHQVAYLAKLYAARPGVRGAGFKLTYVQAKANPALLPLLSLRRVHAVHLIRSNLLAALVSWRVARESGIYHVRRQPALRRLVLLDTKRLRSELEQQELAVEVARRRLERLRLPRLEISYEELVGRQEETFTRVLRFLGVEPQVELLSSTLQRTRAGSPLEHLENAGEVSAALAGTRFEWMLEEAA
jgi:LPS sulfotransferase NodH